MTQTPPAELDIILLATTLQGKTAKQWNDELGDGDSSGI